MLFFVWFGVLFWFFSFSPSPTTHWAKTQLDTHTQYILRLVCCFRCANIFSNPVPSLYLPYNALQRFTCLKSIRLLYYSEEKIVEITTILLAFKKQTNKYKKKDYNYPWHSRKPPPMWVKICQTDKMWLGHGVRSKIQQGRSLEF